MKAKEKAEELFYKMLSTDKLDSYSFVGSKVARQCALICVDEIIKRTRSVDTMPPNCQKIDDNTKEYWQEVKHEIEKL